MNSPQLRTGVNGMFQLKEFICIFENTNLIARVYAIKIHKCSMFFSPLTFYIYRIAHQKYISNMAHIMAFHPSLYMKIKIKQNKYTCKQMEILCSLLLFDIFISIIYINICWAHKHKYKCW